MQLRQRRNRIIFFWLRVLISAFWWDVFIRNFGGRKWANRTALKRYLNHARRFRVMAIELGGVLIKLGQFFASRVDMLPKEIIDELSGLQDEVPPNRSTTFVRCLSVNLTARSARSSPRSIPCPGGRLAGPGASRGVEQRRAGDRESAAPWH